MSAFSSPSEIARETLKQLALRRIPPTPDHYRELYHEIAGSAPEGAALTADAVRQLARRLPRDTAERLRLARELDQAIAGGKAEAMHGALERYLDSLKSDTPPAWNELIATLLRQWEARQLGWTMARKREALERVLAGSDPNTLFTRLQGLIRSWSQTPNDPDAPPPGEHDAFPREAPAAPAAPAVKLVANGETGAFIEQLRELLLLTLEAVVPASLAEQPELTREAANLAAGVRAAHRVADFAGTTLTEKSPPSSKCVAIHRIRASPFILQDSNNLD